MNIHQVWSQMLGLKWQLCHLPLHNPQTKRMSLADLGSLHHHGMLLKLALWSNPSELSAPLPSHEYQCFLLRRLSGFWYVFGPAVAGLSVFFPLNTLSEKISISDCFRGDSSHFRPIPTESSGPARLFRNLRKADFLKGCF